jgi:hypothetical protein
VAKIRTIFKNDDDKTWDFVCGYPSGCGMDGQPFSSRGWNRRSDAAERGKQHLADHEGTPMPPLDEFYRSRGLTAETAGRFDPADIEL